MLKKGLYRNVLIVLVGIFLLLVPGDEEAQAVNGAYRLQPEFFPKSGTMFVNHDVALLEMGSAVDFVVAEGMDKCGEHVLTEAELNEYSWSMSMDGNPYVGYLTSRTYEDGRGERGLLHLYAPLNYIGKLTITGTHADSSRNIQTTFAVTDEDLYDSGKVLNGTLEWNNLGHVMHKEMSNVQWDAENRHYVVVMDEFPWGLPKDGTNFVGWEIDEGDSSRIVQPGETVIFEGRPSATAVFKRFFGWEQDEYGWKYYQGEPLRSTWDQAGDKWYYFGDDAYMKTGWLLWKGNWYYLWNSGAMATGWAWDRGKWYYLKGDGRMATGWLQDGDRWYLLKADGRMATGWQQYKNRWYFLNEDGSMKTGWLLWKDKWYHLRNDGRISVNTVIDGYYVDSNGVWRP